MEIKNRPVIITFFLILSPILAISALVITSVIEPQKKLFSFDLKKQLNWFSEHPDISKNIITVLYILAVIFAVIAIYNIMATVFDRGSDEEVN